MKALFIDVEKRTISKVETPGKLEDIYKLLDCSMVEVPVCINGDDLICDEEALLDRSKIKGGFMFRDWSYPIVGNALLVGSNDEGDWCDCKSNPDDLRGIIWKDEHACKAHSENVVG